MIDQRKESVLVSNSMETTIKIGRGFSRVLRDGDCIILTGPLGAGKTCFIRGLAEGLGIDPAAVKSPSFTLVNEYYGRLPLYHFDLYRINSPTELYQIGWDDYLLRSGIVVVEWGEKAEELLPKERIEIKINILSETQREIKIEFKK